MEKLLSVMPNLQTHYYFKLDFLRMDQRAGESKHDFKNPKVARLIKYPKGMSRGRNIQWGAHLQNQNY